MEAAGGRSADWSGRIADVEEAGAIRVRNQTQLITYTDRLGGTLRGLGDLLNGPLAGLFGGVHILPFYTPIDGADAGFDPTDHLAVDARLGTWDDLAALAGGYDVTADVIVNHISSESSQFRDFVARADAAPTSDMFLTKRKVFPDGADPAALARIYRPRPGAPFTAVRLGDGSERWMWTTFSSQQIDVDVEDRATQRYLGSILDRLAAAGVATVRLDAVGYAVKTPGTSCFMTPATFDFIGRLAADCRLRGLEVLVEVHGHYQLQMDIAKVVDWVYDFALPPLILHALVTADGAPLRRWLEIRPRNAITVLDTHDGIGVVDVAAHGHAAGLLAAASIEELVAGIHTRTGGASITATGTNASNLDLYQVNTTYLDALGGSERWHWLARALQLFAPGIPQIYYVGLLGGRNDMGLLAETGNGRDINRHRFSDGELEKALKRQPVRDLMGLIRLRNTHPAFSGAWTLDPSPPHAIGMEWRAGSHRAGLVVDLDAASFELRYTEGGQLRVVSDPSWLRI